MPDNSCRENPEYDYHRPPVRLTGGRALRILAVDAPSAWKMLNFPHAANANENTCRALDSQVSRRRGTGEHTRGPRAEVTAPAEMAVTIRERTAKSHLLAFTKT